jgi:hypothetical protein
MIIKDITLVDEILCGRKTKTNLKIEYMKKKEGADNTSEVVKVPDCKYCGNDSKLDLTVCDACNVTFCIFCVDVSNIGFERFDVCPGCGDIFNW